MNYFFCCIFLDNGGGVLKILIKDYN